MTAFAVLTGATFRLYAVDGDSMEPHLRPGQIILVNRLAYALRAPRIGDIVAFYAESEKEAVVKRITRFHEDGYLELHGDNSRVSIDSRQYGPVSQIRLIGRVIFVGRNR